MIDLSQKRFGRWTVLGFLGRNVSRNSVWFCVCICGNASEVSDTTLKQRGSRSCGCLKREQVAKRMRQRTLHAENRRGKRTREYQVWAGMKQRCYNPNYWAYHRYGGRGITVYEPWRKSSAAFIRWVEESIGRRPAPGYSLDRINNDGNYEPGNLKWSTQKEQTQNRSKREA